jgi:hypothetical protein
LQERVKALDDATRDNAALKRELTERNQVCDVVVIAYARVLNTSSSSSSSPPPPPPPPQALESLKVTLATTEQQLVALRDVQSKGLDSKV